MRSTSGILAATAVLAALSAPAWAQGAMTQQHAVWRFVSQGATVWMSGTVTTVRVVPALGGGEQEFVIPNKNPMAPKLDPPDFVVAVLKDLKPGDYLDLTVSVGTGPAGTPGGKGVVNRISAYKLKPGEDEPGVYVFTKKTEQKVGAETYDAIEVAKFLKAETVLIPNRKGKDGKGAPDENLLKAASGFASNQTVDLGVEGVDGKPMLKYIRHYEPPTKAVFAKVVTQKVQVRDANGLTQEQDATGMELQAEDGTTVTVLVPNRKAGPGKPQPDAELLKQVRALKPKQAVLYKALKEDSGLWLMNVRPAPGK